MEKRRRNAFPVLLTIASLIASWCTSVSVEAEETVGLKIGDRAPHITVADLNGQVMSLPEDLKGKVAIIHFWASFCCAMGGGIPALGSLERVYNEFKEKGLIIAAINVGQSPNIVKVFVCKDRVSYPVLLDADFKMSKSYGCLNNRVLNLPRTFILDREGVVKKKILGFVTGEMLKELIQDLL